jgi:hypothetical protein
MYIYMYVCMYEDIYAYKNICILIHRSDLPYFPQRRYYSHPRLPGMLDKYICMEIHMYDVYMYDMLHIRLKIYMYMYIHIHRYHTTAMP